MDNTQTITLDIMNDKTYDYIYTKQYDKGREIYFTIVDRGTPISLSGLNVGFELKKPDGNICVYTDTADPSVLAIEGNQVLLTLTDQMTVLSGKLPYQISLLDGEKIISTVTGFVWCEKSAVQYDDVESVSGGSLIEDIQHIDEKINGIMLCGENPPTDDIGDENSRYVQIVDGKVVKEFTKYDGHWVDFPKGGGGSGLFIKDYLKLVTPNKNVLPIVGHLMDAVGSNTYDPWDFTDYHQSANSVIYRGSDGLKLRYPNDTTAYPHCLCIYMKRFDPTKIKSVHVHVNLLPQDCPNGINEGNRFGQDKCRFTIGLMDKVSTYDWINSYPHTSDAWLAKRVLSYWADQTTGTHYITTEIDHTFDINGVYDKPVFLVIFAGAWCFTLTELIVEEV